jgi:hypothetical protein
MIFPPTYRHCLLRLFLPLLMGGCAVMFVSPYDEMTDRSATELVLRTETFLVRYAAVTDETGNVAQEGKPYDREAAAFYTDAKGAAAAILFRSEQKAKNEEEIEILRNLITRYGQLEASHRLGRITKTSAAGLHRTLRALLQVQLTKKHIGTAAAPTTAPAAEP